MDAIVKTRLGRVYSVLLRDPKISLWSFPDRFLFERRSVVALFTVSAE
jgi:hypothetical protein